MIITLHVLTEISFSYVLQCVVDGINGSDHGLVPTRQQAMVWTNDDKDLSCYKVSIWEISCPAHNISILCSKVICIIKKSWSSQKIKYQQKTISISLIYMCVNLCHANLREVHKFKLQNIPEDCFSLKILSYKHMSYHYKDKTVSGPSYLYNRHPYT